MLKKGKVVSFHTTFSNAFFSHPHTIQLQWIRKKPNRDRRGHFTCQSKYMPSKFHAIHKRLRWFGTIFSLSLVFELKRDWICLGFEVLGVFSHGCPVSLVADSSSPYVNILVEILQQNDGLMDLSLRLHEDLI